MSTSSTNPVKLSVPLMLLFAGGHAFVLSAAPMRAEITESAA